VPANASYKNEFFYLFITVNENMTPSSEDMMRAEMQREV
jgi:hypothetical protein